MRATCVIGAALVVSVAVNIGLWRHCSTLADHNDSLVAEIAMLEASRDADMAAMAVAHHGHQDAAKTAQELRDALYDLEKNAEALSDLDFVSRLRGVCISNGESCPQSTGTPDAGVPGTDATSKHDGGK